MSSYVDALLAERAMCDASGQTDRVKDIDAEIKRVSGVVVETADAAPAVETADVRRGPGRPRKAEAVED